MKRILFNWFSETATNAFVHALEFAKVVNGASFIHTFDLPIYDNQFYRELYGYVWIYATCAIWYV
jgi:hypothetical protein